MDNKKECSICYVECIPNHFYKCSCKQFICHDCINEYINHSNFLQCICKKFISPLKIPNTLQNYNKYYNSILKKIELKNFKYIQNLEKENNIIKNIRNTRIERILSFPLCIQYAINNCYKNQLNKIEKNIHMKYQEKNLNYKNICSNTWCDGSIIDNKCDICNEIYCNECKCIKKQNDNHKCNEDDKKTLEFINKTLYKCPNCSLPIEKNGGCNFLTCAACNTNFNHNDNELSSHGGHSTLINMKTKKSLIELFENNDEISSHELESLITLENSIKPINNKIISEEYFNKNYEKTIKLYEKFLLLEEKRKNNIKKLKIIEENYKNIEIIKKILQ